MIEYRNLTRRRMLQLGMLATAGAALPAGSLAHALPPARRTKARTVTGSPYTTPYRLNATSQLSQDFFTTKDVVLEAGDGVFPFYRADGAVAAIVISDYQANLVMPDPTAPNGYVYVSLELPPPSGGGEVGLPLLSSVAVATDGGGVTHLIAAYEVGETYLPIDPGGTSPLYLQYVYGTLSGSTFTKTGELTSYPTRSSFYSATTIINPYYSQNGGGVVPRVLPGGAPGSVTFYGWIDALTYFVVPAATGVVQFKSMPQWEYEYDDVRLIDVEGSTWVVMVSQSKAIRVVNPFGTDTLHAGKGAQQLQVMHVDFIETTTGPQAALLYWYEGSDEPGPTLILALLNDFLDPDTTSKVEGFPEPASAAVLSSGSLWRVGTVSGDMLGLLTQAHPGASLTESFIPSIPFNAGIEQAWAPYSQSSLAATFVVKGVDQTLKILRQSASGRSWVTTQVCRPAADVQEVDSWRTQLSVTDANGIGVGGYPVTVLADDDVALWQDTGCTLLLAGQSAKLTTNELGQIVYSVPATDLHTPSITISGANLPTTTVAADADVHAYLSGKGALSPAGTGSATGMLTASSFQSATKTDANGNVTPLSPVIAGLSGKHQSETATAIVKTINSCVAVGMKAQASNAGKQAAPPSPNELTEFSIDFSSGSPVFASNLEPGAAPLAATPVHSIVDDIGNEFEDAAHAFIHAVDKIAKATFKQVKSVDGVITYAGTIALTFANGVESTLDYVIKDVKSALAAVAGVLATIEAAIEDVIAWLRALLSGLFLEAWQTALALETLIGNITGHVTTYLGDVTSAVDTGVTDLRKALDGGLSDVITAVGGTATKSPSGYAASGSFGGSPVSEFVDKFVHTVQSGWLLNKVLSSLVSVELPGTQEITQKLEALVVQVGQQATGDVSAAITTAVNTIMHSITQDSGNVADLALADFLDLVKDVADLGLTVLDQVVVDAIELAVIVLDYALGVFKSPVSGGLGVIGAILKFLQIDLDLTPQRLICLAVAFPAVILDKTTSSIEGASVSGVRGAGRSTPPGLLTIAGEPRASAGDSPLGDRLTIECEVVTEILESGFEIANEIVDAAGGKSKFLRWAGVLTGLLGTAMSWPGEGGPFDVTHPTLYKDERADTRLPQFEFVYLWLAGFVPSLIDVVLAINEDALGDEFNSENLYFCSGGTLAGWGAYINYTSGGDAEEIAEAIVGWMPTTFDFLTNKTLVDETYAISLLAKLALDIGVAAADITFDSGLF
jgi:hypothetical protein